MTRNMMQIAEEQMSSMPVDRQLLLKREGMQSPASSRLEV